MCIETTLVPVICLYCAIPKISQEPEKEASAPLDPYLPFASFVRLAYTCEV